MKELKDYIHLYIGCRVTDSHNDLWILAGFTESEVEPGKTVAICKLTEPYDKQVFYEFYPEEVKLILRPLSSMTEQDAIELFLIRFNKTKWFNFKLERNHASAFDIDQGYEPAWSIEADYYLSNGKTSHMMGSLSLTEFTSDQVLFLINKGFDLFGLNKSGLAVYA